ncbi:uncharacterized protein LOC114262743 isoform X1 [Camellia sinensis]|uniref:uncharacterized protein LOC114262743 isoform X1 n=1 Tax=Camellia sinensis TaxID=4442 RepID=UPI001036BE46|nr:uncharacterized protein LOC114262743 isoform X1 [Camellia sinensis]
MMKSAARFSSTTWRSLCWTSIKISKVTDLDLDLDPDPDLDFLRSRPSSVVHRFNNNDKITIRRFLRSNRRFFFRLTTATSQLRESLLAASQSNATKFSATIWTLEMPRKRAVGSIDDEIVRSNRVGMVAEIS